MEGLLKFFLFFSLCVMVYTLCIQPWDKLGRYVIANVENVAKFELSIMHANDEKEVPSFFFSLSHLACPIMK